MNSSKHLRRLERVFLRNPVYFVTTVTTGRRPILASEAFQQIALEVWRRGETLYGWSTGPYVLMPDHVHFFCRASRDDASSLSRFVGKWKEWTSKNARRRMRVEPPLWQPEFFDHVIRSNDSLAEKYSYVRHNPERAGLVEKAEQWPYAGNPAKCNVLPNPGL